MGFNIAARLLASLVLLLAAEFGYCSPIELTESATEMELARSLSFHEGEIVVNGKSYLVEDGTVYRLIQGKRYRPRCRDAEMEQIFPRIFFKDLFREGSAKVDKKKMPILDRLGHALRWGDLKDYDFHIAVHGNIPTHKRANAPLSQLRAEWMRDYFIRWWGIAQSRITASARPAKFDGNSEQESNKDANRETYTEIIAVGKRGQGFLHACKEGEDGL